MQWIELEAPSDRKLIAAVWRPAGTGPFPVVVLLHPGSGFESSSILLGEDFAAAGFMTVVGGWFSGYTPPFNPPTPLIDNPGAPAFAGATLESIKYADAIVKVARILPGANGKSVGLMGRSMGAIASVLLASTGTEVQAVVADSAGYTTQGGPPPIRVVQNLTAPLLILHGTADQTTNVQETRDYEQALIRLNKPYEVKYYDGAPHVLTRNRNYPYYADAMKRTIAFFKKYLTP